MTATLPNRRTLRTWQLIYREYVAPTLPLAGLEALAVALARHDPRLTQWKTTDPDAMSWTDPREIYASDPIAFALWQAEGHTEVGSLEMAFCRYFTQVGELSGEPDALKYIITWWDETDIRQAERELLAEVEETLRVRRVRAA